MEKIYAKLDELGMSEEQLPKELQGVIDRLDDRIEKLNTKIEDLESQGVSQDEIDEQTSEEDEEIEDLENDIVETIESYYKNLSRTNTPQGTTNTQVSYPRVNNVSQETKKKSNDGMFILGAIALVVTFGAVNLFKK
jgi:chromosome segregation ATPase